MLTHSDAVEAMARALADRQYVHCGGASGNSLVRGTPNWSFCVHDARAALAALAKVAGVDFETAIELLDNERHEQQKACLYGGVEQCDKTAALLRVLAEAAGEGR